MEPVSWVLAAAVVVLGVVLIYLLHTLKDTIRRAVEKRGMTLKGSFLKGGPRFELTIPGEAAAMVVPETPEDAERMDQIVTKMNQRVDVPAISLSLRSFPPTVIVEPIGGTPGSSAG